MIKYKRSLMAPLKLNVAAASMTLMESQKGPLLKFLPNRWSALQWPITCSVPARNGVHLFVGIPVFCLAVLPAPETLNGLEFFYLPDIALADFKAFLVRHAVAKVYYLVQELRVRGEGLMSMLASRTTHHGFYVGKNDLAF